MFVMVNCMHTRYPEKHWNTEKNAVVWEPYFLIRHTPGIKKIPIWKYFMCILARNFDISDLCTEKWHEFDRKRVFFSIWLTFLVNYDWKIWNKVMYSGYSDSIDIFKQKVFENRTVFRWLPPKFLCLNVLTESEKAK